jgi:hypothetical protein
MGSGAFVLIRSRCVVHFRHAGPELLTFRVRKLVGSAVRILSIASGAPSRGGVASATPSGPTWKLTDASHFLRTEDISTEVVAPLRMGGEPPSGRWRPLVSERDQIPAWLSNQQAGGSSPSAPFGLPRQEGSHHHQTGGASLLVIVSYL